MAQTLFADVNPATTSGPQVATYLNNIKSAMLSGLSGSARPAELSQGGMWVDTTTSGQLTLKLWDGQNDIAIATVNTQTNKLVIAELDSLRAAVLKGFAGAARPADMTKGGLWVDNSVANQLELKMYDGDSDVIIATVNTQTNKIFSVFENAVRSGFLGANRPRDLTIGGMWVDNSVNNRLTLKLYDGTQDISLITVNTQTHTLVNAFHDQVYSGFLAAARPGVITKGGLWVDSSTANRLLLKQYDGVQDVTIATVNSETHELIGGSSQSPGQATGTATKLVSQNVTVERNVADLRVTTRSSDLRAMQSGVASDDAALFGWRSTAPAFGVLDSTSAVSVFGTNLNINSVTWKKGVANGKVEIGIQTLSSYTALSTALKQAGWGISLDYRGVETKLFFTAATVADSKISWTLPNANAIFAIPHGAPVALTFFKESDRRAMDVEDTDLNVTGFLRARLRTLTDFPTNSKEGDMVKIDQGFLGERLPEKDISIYGIPGHTPARGGFRGLTFWGDDLSLVSDGWNPGAQTSDPNFKLITTYRRTGSTARVAAKSGKLPVFNTGQLANIRAAIAPYGLAIDPTAESGGETAIWVGDHNPATSYGPNLSQNVIWSFPVSRKTGATDTWRPSTNLYGTSQKLQLTPLYTTNIPWRGGFGFVKLGNTTYLVGVLYHNNYPRLYFRKKYELTTGLVFDLTSLFKEQFIGDNYPGAKIGTDTFLMEGDMFTLNLSGRWYIYFMGAFQGNMVCYEVWEGNSGLPYLRYRPDLSFYVETGDVPNSVIGAVNGIVGDGKILYTKHWGTSQASENKIYARNMFPPGLYHRTSRGWESFEHGLIYEAV